MFRLLWMHNVSRSWWQSAPGSSFSPRFFICPTEVHRFSNVPTRTHSFSNCPTEAHMFSRGQQEKNIGQASCIISTSYHRSSEKQIKPTCAPIYYLSSSFWDWHLAKTNGASISPNSFEHPVSQVETFESIQSRHEIKKFGKDVNRTIPRKGNREFVMETIPIRNSMKALDNRDQAYFTQEYWTFLKKSSINGH